MTLAVMILVQVILKIEALISITKQAITLTTDIKTISTMDVSKENNAYNICESKLPANTKIAACSWLLSSKSHLEARLTVLRAIFNLIMMRIPTFKLWYLVGDSAWQDDTRIIRHKKLFKRLKSRGVEVTHASDFLECMQEHQGKLKFFGATLLSELSIESVVKMIAEEPCSYLVAMAADSDIGAVIHSGWDASDFIDKGLLSYVAENKGLIFKVVGEFDDPESGFVGLGGAELVKKIVQ